MRRRLSPVRTMARGPCSVYGRAGRRRRPALAPDALQCAERVRARDPVDMQAVRFLKAAHCTLGERSVATIDRSRVEPIPAKLALEPADLAGLGAGIARARIQHRRAQRCERQRSGDAVHAQTARHLKPPHGVLGP